MNHVLKNKPLHFFASLWQSVLVVLLLAFGMNEQAKAGLNDGLVAYWSFDDCTAKDNSGNGYDGTMQNGVSCLSGRKGKALSFDGSSGYVDIPYPQSLVGNPSFTVSFWMKYQPKNSRQWVMFFGEPSVWVGEHWLINPDGLVQFGLWGSSADPAAQSMFNILNFQSIWVQVSTVWNPSSGELTTFVNGIKKVTTHPITTPNIIPNTFVLGKDMTGYESYFSGELDELRIYNRALTDTEVTDIYNSGGKVVDKENILGSLCGITNKTHKTDMLKLVEVDMTNSIIFPSSVEAVSNYRNLLVQKDVANKTSRQLYNKISYLNNKNKQLISDSIGSFAAKDGKAAWSNFLKSAEVSDSLNKLSADKQIAKRSYNILKTKLKKMPASLIHKTGTAVSGLLSVYGTACGLYEMYEDASNIIEGSDLAYNTLNLSWHAINVAGGSLSLWELVTNVPNATSKTLSRSAAFLLVPQAVALGYEWARDNALYEEVDSIIHTHSTTLEFRYFIVDQIVNELAKFRTTTPLDNLRGSIITILGKYPNVYKLDGTLFDADNEFINYLDNVAFLQKQFGKSKYEELTPPELASLAAVYVLGAAASWENSTLQTTMTNNLTKMPVWNKPYTWGDMLPAAFSGKDSFIVFSNLRSQVVNSLNYDVYDDLRTRFDSSFVKQRISIERQIGENIHYYEQP